MPQSVPEYEFKHRETETHVISTDFELQSHLEGEGVTEMYLRNSNSVPQRHMEEEEGDVQSNNTPEWMEQCEPITSLVVAITLRNQRVCIYSIIPVTCMHS